MAVFVIKCVDEPAGSKYYGPPVAVSHCHGFDRVPTMTQTVQYGLPAEITCCATNKETLIWRGIKHCFSLTAWGLKAHDASASENFKPN